MPGDGLSLSPQVSPIVAIAVWFALCHFAAHRRSEGALLVLLLMNGLDGLFLFAMPWLPDGVQPAQAAAHLASLIAFALLATPTTRRHVQVAPPVRLPQPASA